MRFRANSLRTIICLVESRSWNKPVILNWKIASWIGKVTLWRPKKVALDLAKNLWFSARNTAYEDISVIRNFAKLLYNIFKQNHRAMRVIFSFHVSVLLFLTWGSRISHLRVCCSYFHIRTFRLSRHPICNFLARRHCTRNFFVSHLVSANYDAPYMDLQCFERQQLSQSLLKMGQGEE